ncbi:MAG: ABC transporter permease [Chloroflexota bacterium]|nr:ABC transporter permease [Chloroflexota bacterium]
MTGFAKRYGSFVILVAIWAATAQYLAVTGTPTWVLPSPVTVFGEFGRSIREGILPTYFEESMLHLVIAAAIGIIVGVVMGVLIGLNRWAARFFYPLLNFFQSLGGIALAPLMIIWFGFSTPALVIVVDYTVVFPMAFNTLTGVRTIPPVYVNAARTMGANRFEIVRDVLLPGALPNILLGIRLALAYGWRSLIAVEMLFAIDGLGFMIFSAQQYLNTPQILLGMVVIGIVWLVISETIVRPIEDLTIGRWGMVHR